MTEQGKFYIAEYKKGNVLAESIQTLYNKGHITKDEFIETVGHEPQQIDICSAPTTEEKLQALTQQVSAIDQTVADLLLNI